MQYPISNFHGLWQLPLKIRSREIPGALISKSAHLSHLQSFHSACSNCTKMSLLPRRTVRVGDLCA
uniref:Uncharacterized protein n=1 Tax=Parascaris univalens TaxID=6257 RepID=A0A915AWS7_PARUN